MNFSWPHKAAGKAAHRRAGRVWAIGITAVAAAAAAGVAVPAIASTAGAHTTAKHQTAHAVTKQQTAQVAAKQQVAQGGTRAAAKHATKTTMSAVTGNVDSKLTLAAKVTGSSPAGWVKFIFGGKKLCSASLSGGNARCTHVFSGVGSFRVEAYYEGNSTHATSSAFATVKVLALHTTTTVTATADPASGVAVTLEAAVSPATATGNVTFSDAAGTLCPVVKLSGGKASCTYTWGTAGTYTVTAAYGGDATHLGSSGTKSVTVAQTTYPTTTAINLNTINTTPFGTWTYMVPVTVTNSTAGGPAPTGTVTISAPADIQPGDVTVAFTGCTLDLAPVAGTNTSTGSCQVFTPTGAWGFVLMQANYTPSTSEFGASYAGDTAKGQPEVKLINLMPTQTTVGTADGTDTATAGTPVTLVADVEPAPPALPPDNILAAFSETLPDYVSFTSNGAPIPGCTDLPLEWNATAGVNYADCSATFATAATYDVTATFSGDEYAHTSTSPDTDIVVGG